MEDTANPCTPKNLRAQAAQRAREILEEYTLRFQEDRVAALEWLDLKANALVGRAVQRHDSEAAIVAFLMLTELAGEGENLNGRRC